MIPELTDVMGIELSSDGARVKFFISKSEAQRSLENIEDNGWVALSLSRPTNYDAAQIKGRADVLREITEDEREFSRQWLEKYRTEIRLIGVSPLAASSLIFEPDVTVEAQVTELFIQTPGAKAGQALEGQ